MIIRIVKMEFQPATIPLFLSLFETMKSQIRNFEGCQHLTLWQDAKNPTIIFTHSHWLSEEHLNEYRSSDLFRNTWKKAKTCFSAKPQAWSVNEVSIT